jgi:integrase
MVQAQEAGVDRFHFHDIRGKSASDSSSLVEASERLGHSSLDLARRVYRRKPARVKPLEFPRKAPISQNASELEASELCPS